jgi:DNA-binding CsgD family transcriptional regulator
MDNGRDDQDLQITKADARELHGIAATITFLSLYKALNAGTIPFETVVGVVRNYSKDVVAKLCAVFSAAVEITRRNAAQSLIDTFTLREREVAKHLATGKSNKKIGLDLDISEITVKTHVKAIIKKLCVSNRTQAALLLAGHTLDMEGSSRPVNRPDSAARAQGPPR